ncbi:MAG TPA: PVC-type heme-binding CxxCH protein, partial [Pirellulales bacterium]|nr:PVC-type heme-binding CxxCH protein [Pirellulales bacterium]
MTSRRALFLTACLVSLGSVKLAPAADSSRIAVLFLGDRGHHRPADRFRQIRPVLARRGVDVTYTENVGDFNPRTLANYDAVLLYANIDRIEPDHERALLDYVAAGHGFVPLHCASYCFRNSREIVELIGGQFQRHGTGVFRETVARPDHPLMSGYGGFESWDESYVHHMHNEKDRRVLSYRVDAEGREPWTWIRQHGKGRVFYTAWGHDQRTWGHAGFQNLVERGIRWAVGREPAETGPYPPLSAEVPQEPAQRSDANLKPFEYVEAKIPFYPPGQRWGTLADPITKMQKPLEPAESMKHLITPVGFEAELFAAEPDIVKPVTMNWDERGRLWIAETYDYPNELQPAGQGRDRIKICEDTDGDGRADKFTVFADKLSIPTSLTFARGGVIVMQAPDTLFLQDTDGDDKADVRKVLFTGWNTQDTHAGPSNLQLGLDNWLWGMVGYAGFNGTVGGERHRFGQGFYRFLPDGSKLEFLRSTNNNTWGLGFSEEGIVFGSTANRNPSEYLPIANRYYEGVRGWSAGQLNGIADTFLFHAPTEKVRQVDQHGGYTAAAGHALYTAREYPPAYWNRAAFVTDGTGHLVGTFGLTPDGADFHSTNPFNLLGSDDEWTAPIMAEVGPDGHVWVIDWYNYIVQHNPTPAGFKTGKGAAYETELRDKRHGRIYRVVYKAAAPPKPFSLAGAAPEDLVETLRHKNMFWRKHAQRLLVERGQRDVVPLLVDLVRNTDVDEIGLNAPAIHALWTLKGLWATEEVGSDALKAAVEALKHSSAGVRRNAVAVLPPTNDSVEAILEAGLLADADAQVRLAALLALADAPAADEAGEAIAAALARPETVFDKWLPDAVTAAAAKNGVAFLTAVGKGEGEASSNGKATGKENGQTEASADRPHPNPLPEGEGTRRVLAVVEIVAEHYARGGPEDTVASMLSALGKGDPRLAESILGGLAKGWPKGKAVKLDEETETALLQLLPRLSTGSQSQLVRLATGWGSEKFQKYAEEIVQSLTATLGDDKQTDGARVGAARQLVEFRGG